MQSEADLPTSNSVPTLTTPELEIDSDEQNTVSSTDTQGTLEVVDLTEESVVIPRIPAPIGPGVWKSFLGSRSVAGAPPLPIPSFLRELAAPISSLPAYHAAKKDIATDLVTLQFPKRRLDILQKIFLKQIPRFATRGSIRLPVSAPASSLTTYAAWDRDLLRILDGLTAVNSTVRAQTAPVSREYLTYTLDLLIELVLVQRYDLLQQVAKKADATYNNSTASEFVANFKSDDTDVYLPLTVDRVLEAIGARQSRPSTSRRNPTGQRNRGRGRGTSRGRRSSAQPPSRSSDQHA